MKRLITGAGIAFILVAMLGIVIRREHFHVGPQLPHGKVEPAIVGADGTALLLAPNGSLWAWGDMRYLTEPATTNQIPERIGTDSDWCKMAAGYSIVVALKTDGSMWALTESRVGKVTRQSNATGGFRKPVRMGHDTNWTHISAGAGHFLALKDDGSLWAWGQNDRGQVGNGSSKQWWVESQMISTDRDWKVICANSFNSFALKTNGTIWGWGADPLVGGMNDILIPQQIDPGTNWQAVSANSYTLLALKSDGTLWLRGQNAHVTASTFVKQPTNSFIQIGQDKDWSEVYSGQNGFFARKRDGSWWVCGENFCGQLGTGNCKQFGSPTRLPFEFVPWAFALLSGEASTILLTRDGNLWSWGKRLGAPPPSKNLTRVKTFVNNLIKPLSGNSQPFRIHPLTVDTAPHKVWQLPPSIRKKLRDDAANRKN